jgi:hypothetical protein
MRIESRWGLPQKPKLESLNLGGRNPCKSESRP